MMNFIEELGVIDFQVYNAKEEPEEVVEIVIDIMVKGEKYENYKKQ